MYLPLIRLKTTQYFFLKSDPKFHVQAPWKVMFSSRRISWMGCLGGIRIGLWLYPQMSSSHSPITICFTTLLTL